MGVIQILLDSKQGPLPLKGQFQPEADLVPSLYFTGTAQSSTPGATIEVQVGHLRRGWTGCRDYLGEVFSNEAKQHKTMLGLLVNQKPWKFGQTYTYQIVATGRQPLPTRTTSTP